MKREEFTRRTLEILSELTPEQANHLLDWLEAHLWLIQRLEVQDEKRIPRSNRIAMLVKANQQKRIRRNRHVSCPVTGVF